MLRSDSDEFLFDVPLDCEEDAVREKREVRVLGITEEFQESTLIDLCLQFHDESFEQLDVILDTLVCVDFGLFMIGVSDHTQTQRNYVFETYQQVIVKQRV